MRPNYPALFALAVVQFLAAQSMADSTSVRTITLEQCLTIARDNSLVLKQAGYGLRSANLARSELNTTGLPQVRFTAGASFAPGAINFGYDPALSNKGQLGSQLIVEQPLYDGGRRRLQGMQGDLEISRLTQERQLSTKDLEFEARQSFLENLRAQREARLRTQSLAELSEYLDLVKRLNAGGIVPYTDLLKTQVDLVTASTALLQSRQAVTEAKYQLAGLMGTPGDTSFVLNDSLDEGFPIQLDSVTLNSFPDSNRNLELSLARLEYDRSQSEITEVRKERAPTLSLVADAGLLTSRENLMLPASDRYSGLGYSVGLSLDMPLIDWGGQKLRLQQKQMAAESNRLQIDIIRRSYETEYRSVVSRLTSSRSQLSALRDAGMKAEDNFLLTRAKYAAGGVSATEVLSAQQLLTETKSAEIETVRDIQLALAKLVRLGSN